MKFKSGDRVHWKPNDSVIHEGVIVNYVSDKIWNVELPTFNSYASTYCFEGHLIPVVRERRGFATFIHKIEEKN